MCVYCLTFTVKPHLSVQPDLPQIFRGENVTLTCDIPGERVTDWRYVWSTAYSPPPPSDENYYVIRDIKVNPSLKYRCFGSGKIGQASSMWSNEVTLTVIASLILAPTEQIFSGETVTLTCDIKGHTDTEWRYSWYKDDPVYYSEGKKEYSLSVVESDSGEYTCRGERRSDSQRSEISDAVTLTVSAEAQTVLSVSPQNWLTEGDSVNLSCEVRDSSTGWNFSWYKAVSYRQDSSRGSGGSYTLSSAALKNTGIYLCRAERGEPAYHTQYSNPQPLWTTVWPLMVTTVLEGRGREILLYSLDSRNFMTVLFFNAVADPESDDVTYAEIDLRIKKKPRRNQGKENVQSHFILLFRSCVVGS
uniref:Ig-like domain-containing protein n=1 Tax=Astyanax mexicanus TaxID=7994 RepID=A0A3B1IV98_ASTMX